MQLVRPLIFLQHEEGMPGCVLFATEYAVLNSYRSPAAPDNWVRVCGGQEKNKTAAS